MVDGTAPSPNVSSRLAVLKKMAHMPNAQFASTPSQTTMVNSRRLMDMTGLRSSLQGLEVFEQRRPVGVGHLGAVDVAAVVVAGQRGVELDEGAAALARHV